MDIGCGTGGNIAAFAKDYTAAGVDPSRDAIQFARQRFPAVTFIHGEIPGAGDDPTSSADLVLLTDVLEHVPQDSALLSRIVSLIPIGGHVLITVPAHPELWTAHDESFGHVRRYTRESLSALWSDLPVHIRLFSFYNSRLYPLIRAVRRMQQRTGRAAGEQQTDLRRLPAPVNSMLRSLFAGEARRLAGSIDTPGRHGYRDGLSLIVALQRTANDQ